MSDKVLTAEDRDELLRTVGKGITFPESSIAFEELRAYVRWLETEVDITRRHYSAQCRETRKALADAIAAIGEVGIQHGYELTYGDDSVSVKEVDKVQP